MNHESSGQFVSRMVQGLSLVALLMVSGPARALEPPARGTLSGVVAAPDGVPFPGARVWVNTTEPRSMAEAQTDQHGRFRLGPLEPVYRNPYDLLIDANGFARQYVARGTCSVYPGIDADLGTIRLERGRTFTGQVRDEDGTPYPNALVECELARNTAAGPNEHLGVITLKSDAAGQFRTPPLPVADCCLFIRAPGRQEASWRQFVTPGAEQALEPFRLERDVPVPGVVQDEQGRPIAGVRLRLNSRRFETSDATGHFTFHGLGPDLYFFIDGSREGYVDLNWCVRGSAKGFTWNDYHGRDRSDFLAGKELVVVMEQETWIEGRAVDADTGEPVRLNGIELCEFERTATGQVVLKGCRSTGFEQPAPGRFRIGYYTPRNYHLSLHAAGYQEAEAFTPRVGRRETIAGLDVRMRKDHDGNNSGRSKRTVTGRVTRDGRPVPVGWAALWSVSGLTGLLRGRTVVVPPVVSARAVIRDGAYILDAPFASSAWYVVVEEPGQPPTQVGPIPIGENDEKALDIACAPGGGIRGQVGNVPPGWAGHLWIVAFTDTSLRAEAKVDAEGGFLLTKLAPGEYGLKVGHDAYDDSDIPRGFPTPPLFSTDPWERARKATLHPGREIEGLELELPE